ncbi:hypothetical protein M413DRAFT_23581 [Hebeloma cylindrosporum]|uniref:Uncharacterized protein n=1 Tax=Hebeloma cylindrosporum TaxID=76867 RepID=A0A0C2Z2B1_HEBCY|nr:hypothetical protein M413DRAFT_23581 [Hebeloma cylindrosporum h7]
MKKAAESQSKNRSSEVPVMQAPHKPKMMPYVLVPPMTNPIKTKPKPWEEPIPTIEKRGPAYRHRAPVEDKRDMNEMLGRLLGGTITFTTEEILTMAPELREAMKKIVSKKRIAVEEEREAQYLNELEE